MPRPKRGYRTKDGTSVPGVTTIISRFKDSGALLWWACEQGKAIERGEISGLYDKRDKAGEAGTLAHAMVEAFIRGSEPPQTDGIEPEMLAAAEMGFQNFLEWEQNTGIKIIHQEVELVSESHRFGGTLDAIGEDRQGRRCLVDWKTSKGVYADYLIQLAAYGKLWEEKHQDEPITGGFHLCRFSKENADFSHHYWSELDDAWEQFLLFRRAYDLDKLLKRRVG